MATKMQEPPATSAAAAVAAEAAREAQEQKAARAEAVRLARAMAAGESVAAATITAALRASAMSAEEFDRLVGRLRELASLRAVAAGAVEAGERFTAAEADRDALDEEFRPRLTAYQQARGVILERLHAAQRDLQNAEAASQRAGRLEAELGDVELTAEEREHAARVAAAEREHAAEQKNTDAARREAEAALAEHRRRYPGDEHRPDDPIAIQSGAFVHVTGGEIGAGDSAANVFRLFVRAEASRRIAAAFAEVVAAVRAGRDHVPQWRRAVTMRSRFLGAGPTFE